jgi:hypothetical protein
MRQFWRLTRYHGRMPNRRGFLLIVITVTLMFPARATVRAWGKRQLMAKAPGTVLHGAGEVVVTVL